MERAGTVADSVGMWRGLGLDLKAHDALLSTLGRAYSDVFLSQRSRPKGMAYLNFVVSEIHGLRVHELMQAKADGRKVIGTFCVFVPEEIILAADAIDVGLCAGAEIGLEAAEQVLPRNTCALIKSFMGFKLAKVCPYIEACDLVVGETTCDGKTKAYEILGEMAPVYVMEVPHMKEERDRQLWRQEICRFIDAVEDLTGNWITPDRLGRSIRAVNDRRRVLRRLSALRKPTPPPISGRDALLINQVAFYDDPLRFTNKIGELCDELDARIAAGEGVVRNDAPRLLIAGCPMAAPNWKLPFVVETSGAVVVGEESCVGTRNTRDLVAEDGQTLDEMIDRLVDRYMKIDCACFTPNSERVAHVVEMAQELDVDSVIHYALQFCGPYTIEAHKLQRALDEAGVPVLRIETDYSMEDVEVLKNRVEAFVGMLR